MRLVIAIANESQSRQSAAMEIEKDADDPDARAGRGAERQVLLTSAELMRGAREITILHAGETYRLRVTSKDRLILTK